MATTTVRAGSLLEGLVDACGGDSRSGALTILTDLAPSARPNEPVAPPTMAPAPGQGQGPRWQVERRWESPQDDEPRTVVILDQSHAQRQRIGEALEATEAVTGMPQIVMDFSALELPRHVRRQVGHVRWPHRTADVYLYDAMCGDAAFTDHPVGQRLLAATAEEAEALIAWFPTAAVFGFWHSNLGKKRHMVRLAGSFQSEIVGWDPAGGGDPVVRKGLKGDLVNITSDSKIRRSDEHDRLAGWEVADKGHRPSEMGMGQVPYGEGERQTLRPVSFRRITQTASLVFPQLRRLGIGNWDATQDAAARALVAALVLHGYMAAFGAPFVLRSGCALSPQATRVELDGEPVEIDDDTATLVRSAVAHAKSQGVPLDGWDRDPLLLTPKSSLADIIAETWPRAGNDE
jgi:hypothetical protein